MKPENIYKQNGARSLVVFIPGTGDGTEMQYNFWRSLLDKIDNNHHDYLFIDSTFIFNGDHKTQELIDHNRKSIAVILEQYHTIRIFASSMGAYVSTFLVEDELINKKLTRLILLDPADYPLSQVAVLLDQTTTWSGYKEFNPVEPVSAIKMREIEDIVIDVAYFTLRNYSKDGYIDKDYKDRRGDHVGGVTRLSKEMVRNFYENVQMQNRGYFIEVPNLPHGFERDGDIEENKRRLVELIRMFI